MDNVPTKILKFPRNATAWLISLYQASFSPDHGWFKARYPYGYCRHFPSCSEYSRQAILKHGLMKGGWKGIKRVARCNPWVEPSVDPVK